MLAFIAGIATVPFALVFQNIVNNKKQELVGTVPLDTLIAEGGTMLIIGVIVIVLWAAIEELLKYGTAYLAVLRRREIVSLRSQ